MNIHGIGTDIVSVKRIANLISKYPDRFLGRILSPAEIINYGNSATPTHYVSKRFAAKEAIAKAIGTGIGKSMAFNEISILNYESGKPFVSFSGQAKATVEALGLQDVMISLSDENEYSLAFAVVI